MAMSVGSGAGSSDPMVEANTTPLIDVMPVLLVMLIVPFPLQTHDISLDNPPPNPLWDSRHYESASWSCWLYY